MFVCDVPFFEKPTAQGKWAWTILFSNFSGFGKWVQIPYEFDCGSGFFIFFVVAFSPGFCQNWSVKFKMVRR